MTSSGLQHFTCFLVSMSKASRQAEVVMSSFEKSLVVGIGIVGALVLCCLGRLWGHPQLPRCQRQLLAIGGGVWLGSNCRAETVMRET